MTRLRKAAMTALIVGAVSSLALMARMGQRQASILVIVLFVLWDAAPFVLLGVAEALATRWPPRLQTTLHWVAIVVAAGSVAAYLADTLGPPHPQAAFIYVIVPPVAVVAAAAMLLTAHGLYNVK